MAGSPRSTCGAQLDRHKHHDAPHSRSRTFRFIGFLAWVKGGGWYGFIVTTLRFCIKSCTQFIFIVLVVGDIWVPGIDILLSGL